MIEFLQQGFNGVWLALALVSGALLLWPLLRGDARNLAPPQATLLMNRENATVIDVREKNAWAGGHIAGARHIPLAQLGQRIGELEKLKGKPVIVCCASGVRGAAAGEQLRKAGFEKVFNLNGGIAAWQDAKLPLTTKS
jgi:rhodanese-related sulfurtransferase